MTFCFAAVTYNNNLLKAVVNQRAREFYTMIFAKTAT